MEFLTLDTPHFRMLFSEPDREWAVRFSVLAEDTVLKLSLALGISNDIDRQDFYICPDAESFILYTGKSAEEYQDWMVGNADRRLNRLCLLSPRVVADRPPEAMEQIALHETVHIVFDQLCDPESVPVWASEGAAVLYACQTVIEYLDENNCPSLADISDDDFAENGGYAYSGVYVWYFIERFGFEAFKKLYCGAYPSDWYYSGFEAEAVKTYKQKFLKQEEK